MTTRNPAEGSLAFVGGGNMAEALIAGFIRADAWPAAKLTASDPDASRRSLLHERYGIQTFAENAGAVSGAAIVVLAVKPQVMPEAVCGLRGMLPPDSLVLSIAAGIPTTAIEAWLGGSAQVIRVMPNTPTLFGLGAHAWCRGKHATARDARTTEKLLKAAGKSVELAEAMLDAATALSGSGPAYVFYLAEAMLQAARDMGLEPETARLLTAATIEGAGRMLTASGENPAELRRRVTSKGGTTAAAAEVLEKAGVKDAVIKAIRAAQARAAELSAAYAPKP